MSIENILNIRKIDEMTAIAGQPTEEELRELKQQGYECVLNLAPIDPRYSLDDEEGLIHALEMEYLFQPIDFNRPTLDDFYRFEENLSKLKGRKSFIHCAANYRASVFFGHYAIRHLGWSEAQCDNLISGVWRLSDFPVWKEFTSLLRQHVTPAPARRARESSLRLDRIVDTLQAYLVPSDSDEFERSGRAFLRSKVQEFMDKNEKLLMILPGFPCKSPNKVHKTFGVMPDMGEVLALEQLEGLCQTINELYAPGCELTILCDGTTFSDIVGVPDEEKEAYKNSLRTLIPTQNIRWMDLSAFYTKANTDAEVRRQLIEQTSLRNLPIDKYIAKVKKDERLSASHDKWCSYLYNDIRLEQLNCASRDHYLESIAHKAYEMMYRGQALVENIDRTFPRHIRLSVHQYNNSGPKFTVALMPGAATPQAPWHNVPVRLKDGRYRLVPRSQIQASSTVLVRHGERNWFYMEVDHPAQAGYSFEIIKAPRFGLAIRAPSGTSYQALSSATLSQWIAEFGFVLLKDVKFPDQDALVDFCRPYGEIYVWDFGPVHVVKPYDKPDGFVHSTEKVPLHWDLSMLPLTHERVIGNEMFAARMFVLYCNKTEANAGGQTTLVDSRTALRIAGPDTVERWKHTNLTYFTKMTYFGGVPRTYPLVVKHPDNDDWILRYQEGSESPLQEFLLSSDGMGEGALKTLINEVNDIAYDERCLVAHNWEIGDLLLVDNYYTLHGRLPMSSSARELWRVQIV